MLVVEGRLVTPKMFLIGSLIAILNSLLSLTHFYTIFDCYFRSYDDFFSSQSNILLLFFDFHHFLKRLGVINFGQPRFLVQFLLRELLVDKVFFTNFYFLDFFFLGNLLFLCVRRFDHFLAQFTCF